MSPSQSKDSLEAFVDNLELNFDAVTVNNPRLIVVLGLFQCPSRYVAQSGKNHI